MLEGKKISAMLPISWKKSFNNGVVIPVKMRRCKIVMVNYYVTNVIIKLTKTKNSKLIYIY